MSSEKAKNTFICTDICLIWVYNFNYCSFHIDWFLFCFFSTQNINNQRLSHGTNTWKRRGHRQPLLGLSSRYETHIQTQGRLLCVQLYDVCVHAVLLQRPLHGFQIGMKLEAVDKRNPMLIRVSTVVDTEDHRLKAQHVLSLEWVLPRVRVCAHFVSKRLVCPSSALDTFWRLELWVWLLGGDGLPRPAPCGLVSEDGTLATASKQWGSFTALTLLLLLNSCLG